MEIEQNNINDNNNNGINNFEINIDIPKENIYLKIIMKIKY